MGHLRHCSRSSPVSWSFVDCCGFPLLPAYGYVALDLRQCLCPNSCRPKALTDRIFKSSIYRCDGDHHRTSRVFLYANRQWAPMKIAVVPGATPVAELPKLLKATIEISMLNSARSIDFVYSGVVADLNWIWGRSGNAFSPCRLCGASRCMRSSSSMNR